MKFAFDETQKALAESARKFLSDHASSEQTRDAMSSELGYSPDVWRRLTELGWTAAFVPEAYGGFGFSHVELVALMEEMGRALLCSPFFATVALGGQAIITAGNAAQKQTWLPHIASGELLSTLASTGTSGQWGSAGVTTVAHPHPDGGYLLSGQERFVLDGHHAGIVVVAARAPGSKGDDGIGLFAVAGDAEGLTRKQLATMDQTRRLASLTFADVQVSAEATLCAPQGNEGARLLEIILDLASVALAAEQVGGAERCLEMAVEYAKVREQFGRPIGSFQAIKHMCADMLLQVESARSASYYAGWVAAQNRAELAEAASVAKSYCSEAFFHCAAQSIQIHGGIGFTWEHDAHLFFKRARAGEGFLGEPSWHRERIAQSFLGD